MDIGYRIRTTTNRTEYGSALKGLATLAVCTGLSLGGCDLSVQDASIKVPVRQFQDSIVAELPLWMLDSSNGNMEMLKASTRPMAVIHWLDMQDTVWTGGYRGMAVEVKSYFPDSARILFHHPRDFFGYPRPQDRRWQVGLVYIANDGDSDGKILNWSKYEGYPSQPGVKRNDSLIQEYEAFNNQVLQIKKCPTDSCQRRKVDDLEAWSDRIYAAAVGEFGFRAAIRKGLATDWYIASSSSLLAVWIPDEVALAQVSLGIDRHCKDSPNTLHVGMNFKHLRDILPRNELIVQRDNDSLLYAAVLENYRNFDLKYECGEAMGGFRFSTRMFEVTPPTFQHGPNDPD